MGTPRRGVVTVVVNSQYALWRLRFVLSARSRDGIRSAVRALGRGYRDGWRSPGPRAMSGHGASDGGPRSDHRDRDRGTAGRWVATVTQAARVPAGAGGSAAASGCSPYGLTDSLHGVLRLRVSVHCRQCTAARCSDTRAAAPHPAPSRLSLGGPAPGARAAAESGPLSGSRRSRRTSTSHAGIIRVRPGLTRSAVDFPSPNRSPAQRPSLSASHGHDAAGPAAAAGGSGHTDSFDCFLY
jgi:hypothetical protein